MSFLNDSQLSDKPNYRQQGRVVSGHVARGSTKSADPKTHAGSIPSKYETILYRNSAKPAFGASSQRFAVVDDLSPGPCSYSTNTSFSMESTAPSVSKKGMGNGFASRSDRNAFKTPYLNMGPGPGQYESVEKPFEFSHVRPANTAFSRAVTSGFPSRQERIRSEEPGPGHYKADKKVTSNAWKPSNIGSVFKSLSKRYPKVKENAPPPGVYNISRDLQPKKPFKVPDGTHVFARPTTKYVSEEEAKRQMVNEALEKEDPKKKQPPGPGYYFKDPGLDENSLFKQRISKKVSPVFVMNNQTRFGEIVEKKANKVEMPGPGYYEREYTEEDKQLVSGAVFMSETARKPFIIPRNQVPITKYNPEPIPKKSFHLNMNKSWMI